MTESPEIRKTRDELDSLLRKLDTSLSQLRGEIGRVRKVLDDERKP